MARLLREVLDEYEFFGAFEMLVFANLVVEKKGVANFIEFQRMFAPEAVDEKYHAQLEAAFTPKKRA